MFATRIVTVPLEAALDSLRDRYFADTPVSERDASNLRLTEENLGEGITVMVKAGESMLEQVNMKVSSCAVGKVSKLRPANKTDRLCQSWQYVIYS